MVYFCDHLCFSFISSHEDLFVTMSYINLAVNYIFIYSLIILFQFSNMHRRFQINKKRQGFICLQENKCYLPFGILVSVVVVIVLGGTGVVYTEIQAVLTYNK